MAEATITGYKIRRIDMENGIEMPDTIKTDNTFSFDVTYSLDKTTVTAVLSEQVFDTASPQRMHINVEIQGVFVATGMETEDDRRQVSIACYNELFPFANKIVMQIANNSGLKGLMLKKVQISPEEIGFMGMGQEGKEPAGK